MALGLVDRFGENATGGRPHWIAQSFEDLTVARLVSFARDKERLSPANQENHGARAACSSDSDRSILGQARSAVGKKRKRACLGARSDSKRPEQLVWWSYKQRAAMGLMIDERDH